MTYINLLISLIKYIMSIISRTFVYGYVGIRKALNGFGSRSAAVIFNSAFWGSLPATFFWLGGYDFNERGFTAVVVAALSLVVATAAYLIKKGHL